jgi:RNA polymerase sigma factor for flagellar operon FliA
MNLVESPDQTLPSPPDGELAPTALMERHLPLVRMLAAKLYRLRWDNSVRFDEFCQMGAVGLAEAAHRYDPARGAQFASYATWRITGAILNGLEHSTERNRQAGARRRLLQDRAASWGERAASEGDSLEAALARLSDAAIGLAVGFMLEGTGMYSDGDEITRHDGYRQIAATELMQRLRSAVDSLPPAERTVVEGHYFHQRSFVDVAGQLGLTKGRISQIHRVAIERLRAALREQMIGFDG